MERGGDYATKTFKMQGPQWGSARQPRADFVNLETFVENASQDAAPTHVVGAKLLWLDESFTEGDMAPYRWGTKSGGSRWAEDHMVYNVCPVANWNIRAQLTTRSPASLCGIKSYMFSTGPWMVQFSPFAPQEFNDIPDLNDAKTAYVKNPFGAALSFSESTNVVLYDLPSEECGVLSMARLRHAMLSPYSWNPSYIVGHSLRDLHAPADSTAHEVAVYTYQGSATPTRWDYLLGASESETMSHGTNAHSADSQGLMQIGSDAVTKQVVDVELSSKNEVLAYDIAYEVNHYLWDKFFISGMPLSEGTEVFDWSPTQGKYLWNRAYGYNRVRGQSLNTVVDDLSSSDGTKLGFWKNAQFIKNRAAFNVNSTSVVAWTAFLSSTLGVSRPMAEESLADDQLSFARSIMPQFHTETAEAKPDKAGGWAGARVLSQSEVKLLAGNIVIEVKKRGPFISLADFVNRRLTDEADEASRMGTLDAAIVASGLNSGFEENPQYLSTTTNRGKAIESLDNNLPDFKDSYRYEVNGEVKTVQPTSQAWGMPGFLTQGDVLESLAPSLTTRGDSFTIRCYGESSDKLGIKAVAWLEVDVERSPQYIDAKANEPTDRAQWLDYATGQYLDGNLSEVNKKWGRKFVIKSFRWLSPDEI